METRLLFQLRLSEHQKRESATTAVAKKKNKYKLTTIVYYKAAATAEATHASDIASPINRWPCESLMSHVTAKVPKLPSPLVK